MRLTEIMLSLRDELAPTPKAMLALNELRNVSFLHEAKSVANSTLSQSLVR